MTETAPEVTEVEKQLDKTTSEVQKVEEKLDDPRTSEAERVKLEQRLDSLDARMDKLIEKLDTIASSPVAPAPRKVGDTTIGKDVTMEDGTVDQAVTPEPTTETPKERKHRYGSRTWWGDRAYESE